jgi:hypothetical protein
MHTALWILLIDLNAPFRCIQLAGDLWPLLYVFPLCVNLRHQTKFPAVEISYLFGAFQADLLNANGINRAAFRSDNNILVTSRLCTFVGRFLSLLNFYSCFQLFKQRVSWAETVYVKNIN